MEKSIGQKSDHIQFLSNPQKQGVWALAIQPEPASIDTLRDLLNLREFSSYGYRHIDTDTDEFHGVPCCVVPRLFCYLRYLLPHKVRREMPPLFPFEREPWLLHRGLRPRRFGPAYFIRELTTEPRSLSSAKKRALSKAAVLFKSHFKNCTISPAPEQPSGLDIASHRDRLHFQTQEDADGRITVYSLQEDTCTLMKRLLEALPGFRVNCELRKVFSPETQLLAMYIPTLAVLAPQRILRDATVQTTIAQTMSEVREERFVHAIRAVGIGAEELIVEVFETYLHDKAPEAPLGNLLSELNSKIQDVVGGAKPRKKAHPGTLKKALGTALTAERKKAQSNPELCAVIETVLQGVVPALQQLVSTVAAVEDVAVRPQKTAIFPPHVNRALSDLVPLRNRVSHRVDRLSAARSVTYLEAALAMKSYIVLSLWWQEERRQIDYRVGMKEAIKKAIDRNQAEPEE